MRNYLVTDRTKKDELEDRTIRFRYLLGISDQFKHFIDVSAAQDPNAAEILASLKEKPRKKSRKRKTEKEEDAELLMDEESSLNPTARITESPPYIEGTLREYQVQGLNWMIQLYENKLSGILADEMGLGKTLQSIAFLGHLRYTCGVNGPFIVVVPKSTLDNWRREFAKWTPEVDVLVLQGDKNERQEIIQKRLLTSDFDVCITSFEMVIREKSKLSKIKWEYIIVDEAHRIKNEESSLSQIIRLFYSRNRLLITGTPLQNNLHELWALLNFLLPDVFKDSDTFDRWFESHSEDQDKVVHQLHSLLSPFLLRRVKSDVEKSLLPKRECNVYVGMSEMQVKWYKNLLEKDIDAISGGMKENKTRLLNIVMQLRKCCNHPYLFEGAEPGPPFTTDEHLVENSGKLVVLDKLLKKVKEQGSRVLIFSQMSRQLDIMEDYCYLREFDYCRIDGSTSHEDRIAAIDEYNAPDSDKFIFLLTTRAGGLGINLTSADVVVLYDSDWNPQADLQAMDRAHRIGQTKQVRVFRFVTENAIEEKVLERAAQKLRLDQLVIQQGRSSSTAASAAKAAESKDALLGMIQHGAQKVLQSKGTMMADADIDTILARGEERTEKLKERFSTLGLDDLQNFSVDSSTYEWNGEKFTKEAPAPVLGLSKRERNANYVNYKERIGARKYVKGPKPITLHDYQFYPAELADLLEREQLAFRKTSGDGVSLREVGYTTDDEFLESDDEGKKEKKRRRATEQEKIDNAEELTESDLAVKDKLIDEGFSSWNKREFGQFIHLNAEYGRDAIDQIASRMKSKTADQVKAYADVFWQRYKEIDGWERYISQIEVGENKIAKIKFQQEWLAKRVADCKAPLEELEVQYPPNSTKRTYSEAEDRFLLCMCHKHGLNKRHLFEIVKDEISKNDQFQFNWFFASRTPQELSRRTNTLLLSVSKATTKS